MRRLAEGASRGGSDFRAVAQAFLAQPGLPFLSLLSAERIERVFARQGNLFGQGTIYSTAIMVWSFLGQVLRDPGPIAPCGSIGSFESGEGCCVVLGLKIRSI